MSNANKTIKKPKEKQIQMEGSKKNIILIAVLAAVVLIVCGAVGFEKLHKDVIITLDNKKLYLDDLIYYIYMQESQANMMQQYFGNWDWDAAYDEEKTMREAISEQILDQAIRDELLYEEAKKEGLTLTEEDEEAINSSIEEITASFTSKKRNKLGLTKSNLKSILTKLSLAQQYQEKKSEEFEVDEQAIRGEIDEKDYEEYKVNTIFISTETTNEDGESVDMTEEEKQKAYDKIAALLDKAKETKDFTTLVGEEETQLQAAEELWEKDDTYLSEADMKKVLSMKNGEVTDVLEGESGYYIIRMVDNECSDSYEQAVSDKVQEKREEMFEEQLYNPLKEEHTYEINTSAWEKITLGTVISGA